ncbi:MAG: EAL domain-containing protein [Legionellaceae bacterium]|nr:EAL domain-containing protein [Legionellaceae bacterium]
MLRRFQILYVLMSILLSVVFLVLSVKQFHERNVKQLTESAIAARNQLDYFFINLIKHVHQLEEKSKIHSDCHNLNPHLQAFNFTHPHISGIGIPLEEQYCISVPGLILPPSLPTNTLSGPLVSPAFSEPYYVFRYQNKHHTFDIYLLATLLTEHIIHASPFINAANLFLHDSLVSTQDQGGDHRLSQTAKFPWLQWQQEMNVRSNIIKNLNIQVSNDPERSYQAFWVYELIQISLFFFVLLCLFLLLHYYFRHRYSLKANLKAALRKGHFFPLYQPIYDWRKPCFSAVEVLLRWQDGTHTINPDTFIKEAEKSGLIVPITKELIKRSFTEMQQWLHLDRSHHIAFNISRIHLLDTQLIELLQEMCNKHTIANGQVMLELTERELIDDTDHEVLRQLHSIRDQGFLLAIDDFGTGNSSIHYLNHVPANYLKIDMLYTQAIGSDAITARLVEPIIALAKKLHLTIIAEGVETEEQAQFLRTQGVDLLQGWLYAKAMPGTDCLDFLISAPPT